jgi:hypothetical protein
METKKILMPALRQYKSNDGSDGYVIAYEKGCVDVIVEALEQENEKLRKGIKTVRILIDESHGVAGLHLNGEIAAWDTLELGGWAEEWLIDFNESEIALALHKEGES